MHYAVILAGGAGLRLWPMSRRATPKHLLPLVNGRSLLALAIDRAQAIVPAERVFLCTSAAHAAMIRAALPAFPAANIIMEPEGRDTLNAIGLCSALLAQRDPQATLAILTADHIIEPVELLREAMHQAFALVEEDSRRIITFAVTPDHASTAYGYIEFAEPAAEPAKPQAPGVPGAPGGLVSAFIEKPALEDAQRYFTNRTHAWNSGMLVFAAQHLLHAIDHFVPDHAEAFHAIRAAVGDAAQRERMIAEVYPELPKVSVDRAIMQQAAGQLDWPVLAIQLPAELRWLDIGSWPSLGETLTPDAHGNRTNTNFIHLDSRNMLAISDDPSHTIAAIGCDALIIVRTRDATLICRADQAQRVKELHEQLPHAVR